MMNRKILLPVDFSPLSPVSCEFAAGFAGLTGRDVILFHSFFDQIYFSDGGFSTGFESGILLTDELILDLYKQKEKRLKEMAEEYQQKPATVGSGSPKFEALIENGDPEVQIPNLCRSLKPDLVAMGSAGLGQKGRFPGSVCEKVMNTCGLPVLAIPETARFHGIERVIYMTEFDPADIVSVHNLSQILSTSGIRIDCLHLCSDDEQLENQHKMDVFQNKVEALQLPQEFKFVLLDCDDPAKALKDYTSMHKTRIIAFIPHHRSFFRSLIHQDLTKKDLFLTQIPILSLP